MVRRLVRNNKTGEWKSIEVDQSRLICWEHTGFLVDTGHKSHKFSKTSKKAEEIMPRYIVSCDYSNKNEKYYVSIFAKSKREAKRKVKNENSDLFPRSVELQFPRKLPRRLKK